MKVGRPKLTQPKSDRLNIRVLPNEKELLQQTAQRQGLSLSEFILKAALTSVELV